MTACLLENVWLNRGDGPVEIFMEGGTIRAIAPRIDVPEGLPRRAEARLRDYIETAQ